MGEATLAYVHEGGLYPPIRDTLATYWAKERPTEPLAVEITAAQGRRRAGGRWTRPVAASVRRTGEPAVRRRGVPRAGRRTRRPASAVAYPAW